MNDIGQAIKDYIAKEFILDKPGIVLDSHLPLIEEGIIDSLGIFVLIAYIEDRFKVKIQPAEVVLENFKSIDAIEHLISSRLPANQSKHSKKK